ncbi:hypothetical protein RRG08_001745 [Elysia crispata]|uniref:Uncharacterized protein n=1 Tax=Elysia crispata TaxID=231223 RepID=A0AAE1AMB2_9GAST|nr:hypothetical protein RRG08_001745 [Elysia crispata]
MYRNPGIECDWLSKQLKKSLGSSNIPRDRRRFFSSKSFLTDCFIEISIEVDLADGFQDFSSQAWKLAGTTRDGPLPSNAIRPSSQRGVSIACEERNLILKLIFSVESYEVSFPCQLGLSGLSSVQYNNRRADYALLWPISASIFFCLACSFESLGRAWGGLVRSALRACAMWYFFHDKTGQNNDAGLHSVGK